MAWRLFVVFMQRHENSRLQANITLNQILEIIVEKICPAHEDATGFGRRSPRHTAFAAGTVVGAIASKTVGGGTSIRHAVNRHAYLAQMIAFYACIFTHKH